MTIRITEKHNKDAIRDFLTKLRNIVSNTCKYYQTDLAIDVEALLLEDLPEQICWSCGEHGTHFIQDDNWFDAVKANYGNTDVYILDLVNLTVTQADWSESTRAVLPKYLKECQV